MPIINNTLLAGASGQGGGYQIDQSIRFNVSDAAYLTRTPGSSGDRKTFTFSTWVKRGKLGVINTNFFGAGPSNEHVLRFQNNDTLHYYEYTGGFTFDLKTTQVFRDSSAWYHVVAAVDTTQATASDRIKIYVNGSQVTSFTTASYPSLNLDTNMNKISTPIRVGWSGYSTQYFDGYMAENILVDGQALDPTDFGETNNDGVWIPKKYAGTYGTNGFYITGADSADLGADYSGNNNDFTATGLTSDDQRGDTPTVNHATWNPLFFRRTGSYTPTFADGNLYVAGQSSQVSHTGTTISSTGKHYAEFLVNNGSSTITGPGVVRSYWDGGLAQSYASNYGGSYYSDNGTRYYNNTSDSQTAPGANRIGIEVDFANNEVEYFIVTSGGTRTAQGAKLTSSDGIDFDGEGIFTATLHDTSSRNVTAYFEAADWWGTPNAGYEALSTANLAAPTVADGSAHFNTILYTGDGSATTRSFTGVGFQPDFVWKKVRSAADHHWLHDAVRGADKGLNSNRTDSEYTSTRLTSFDSDGFSFATSDPDTNGSGRTYVAWNWLAGNGTSSNTDGSITSTVSANTTAGFSIVGYTGNGTNGATVGHGLSQRPEFLIVKRRSGAAENWRTQDIFNTATDYMNLSGTAASVASAGQWNNTEPTSSVFTLGTDTAVNASGSPYISYCFHSVENFSKVGQYTGNGSTDGPFVWCGFRPAFVLCKATSAAYNWAVRDSKRLGYNDETPTLAPDTNTAEYSVATGYEMDLTANGFKIRNLGSSTNSSGVTYIFMAFAEHPFGGDNVSPVPAR